MTSPGSRHFEPSPLELIEEAVHLLRRAPAGTLAIYYAGAVPFVLGGLFFWAHTTWFLPASDEIAWSAVGLVGLYAVMKTAHAAFCARLLAMRLGQPAPEWTWARWRRVSLAQLRLQPWALIAGILAALLAVPFGWVYACAQNVSVLGADERLHDEAVAQAKLWPGQNHVGLLMISLLALGMWLNLAGAFMLVPWLANRLLGIENVFGISGWSFLNTTFIASVTALTWLAVDPLVKAFYVLRVFHGRARRTGDDVRVDLQLARRASGFRRTAGAAVGSLLLMASFAGDIRGEETPAASRPPALSSQATSVQPAQLDRAIDDVLARPDFRWKLRPHPADEAKTPAGPIKRFLRHGIELFVEMLRSAGRVVGRIVDWFADRFWRDSMGESSAAGGGAGGVVRSLLYLFVGAAVLLILWLIWLLVRSAWRHAVPVMPAQAVAAAKPDLRDEDVQAAQLPVDGWLALAREHSERGEWRLALRALYLATLARLASDGLVSLAKFKTNLDYEREVRRRALARSEIVAGFAARRREFEDVWYGRAEPGESHVRAWMAELEGPVTR